MNKVACTAKTDGIAIYYENGERNFIRFKEPLQLYRKRFKERVVDYEVDRFSPAQDREYKIALYGLAGISDKERSGMREAQIRKVRKKFLRSQKEINRYKNEVMEGVLKGVFAHSRIFAEKFTDEYDNCRNPLSFSELGITKRMIIDRLLSKGILQAEVFDTR